MCSLCSCSLGVWRGERGQTAERWGNVRPCYEDGSWGEQVQLYASLDVLVSVPPDSSFAPQADSVKCSLRVALPALLSPLPTAAHSAPPAAVGVPHPEPPLRALVAHGLCVPGAPGHAAGVPGRVRNAHCGGRVRQRIRRAGASAWRVRGVEAPCQCLECDEKGRACLLLVRSPGKCAASEGDERGWAGLLSMHSTGNCTASECEELGSALRFPRALSSHSAVCWLRLLRASYAPLHWF